MSQKTAAVARTSMAARVAANTVPGIGPLIASAMVAAIGNGAAFAKGRDFAAWLGLVPKQIVDRGASASAVIATYAR
jgi:transposase